MELGLLVVAAAVLALLILLVMKPRSRQVPPPPVTAPGWYPDPANPNVVRWFDGQQWTQQTQQRLY